MRGYWGREGPSPTSAPKAVEGGGESQRGSVGGGEERGMHPPPGRAEKEAQRGARPREDVDCPGAGVAGSGTGQRREGAVVRPRGWGTRPGLEYSTGTGAGRGEELGSGSEGASSPWRRVGVRRLPRR